MDAPASSVLIAIVVWLAVLSAALIYRSFASGQAAAQREAALEQERERREEDREDDQAAARRESRRDRQRSRRDRWQYMMLQNQHSSHDHHDAHLPAAHTH